MNNDQVAELTGVSSQRIRSLIRRGRLRLFDYPNLADACDLCEEPIRQGKLCVKCLTRLKGAIEKDQEKLRQQRENVFLSKFRR
ncbi:hypothetical protein GZH47_14260 [Paenibacillus rhizovicinus]|uniref:Helix-turn-helix domain-containing protein n=1 Tax=Paenibacillus rhizovicinus TaxID=2704463 RepID=A0A6C0P1X7_9BACL|nr:hypothetical protein [Paenibacillus rhizovicinus]QHW31883.1 hypothetical protein GZH47_14260 [Paenibacillus rhizovicinus]